VKLLAPTPAGVEEAAALIRAGHVVAYPTETIYGLAADPFNEHALAALFACKARDPHHPILLLVSGLEQLRAVAAEIPPAAMACIQRHWPGPLSLLLPKSPRLPEMLAPGFANIGVRQSSHPVAQALCVAARGPITSTSANRSGQPPVRTLAELDLPGVAAGIDAGPLPESAPSTIYDPVLRRIVRSGAIAAEELD